jgi:hypothetical protein
MGLNQAGYVCVFFAHNGPGPFVCRICGEEVFAGWDSKLPPMHPKGLCIHHIDGDRSNNVPENLEAMHIGCHSRKIYRVMSDAARNKISQGLHRAYDRGQLSGKKHAAKMCAYWASRTPEQRTEHGRKSHGG